MRIKKLEVTNFRNIAQASVELEPVSVILGENSSGKSSLLAAIEWALRGRAEWLNDKGEGQGRLVRMGAQEMRVEVLTDKDVTISRKLVNGRVTLQAAAGGGKLAPYDQAKILAGFKDGVGFAGKVSQGHLALSFNALRFFGLPEQEQQALLFDLLGGEIPDETMIQELNARKSGLGGQAQALGVFAGPDAPYDAAYKMRAAKKVALGEARTREQAILSQAGPTEKELDPFRGAEIESDLAALRKEDRAALDQQHERNALKGQAGKLEADLQKVQAVLNEAGNSRLRRGDAEKKLQGLRQEAAEKDKALKELGATLAPLLEKKARQDALRDLRTALAAKNAACPLMEHVFCPLRDEERAALLKDEAGEALEKEILSLRSRQDALKNELGPIYQQIIGLEAQVNTPCPSIEDLEKERSAAIDALKEAEEKLAALGDEKGQAAKALEVGSRIDALVREQRALDQAVGGARAREEQRQQLPAVQERIRGLERGVEDLEELVRALAPDGVKATILVRERAGILRVLNEVLKAWKWAADIDPAGRQLYLISQGMRVSWEDLSASERLRLGVAVQVAAAARFGTAFLIVDDAEALGPENRSLLLNALARLVREKLLDQAIIASVLATVGPDGKAVVPAAPTAPGVGLYLMEDGAIRRVLPALKEVAA